jgi:rhodanese-related sulfurtransferase
MSSIQRLAPPEAFASLQAAASALLVDVRDPIEFAFVGHPKGAVNIPWKLAPDMRPNQGFVEQVRRVAPDAGTPLFLLCRSGQRSLDAANALANAGYRNLTNIEEGFEGPLDEHKHRSTLGGWRYHGLPWEQS